MIKYFGLQELHGEAADRLIAILEGPPRLKRDFFEPGRTERLERDWHAVPFARVGKDWKALENRTNTLVSDGDYLSHFMARSSLRFALTDFGVKEFLETGSRE